MPGSDSFAFVRGEDAQIDWTIYQTSALAAVQDITGYVFSFKVKRRDDDADPSLVTGTTTIVTAGSGTAKTVLGAAETAGLIGDYRYALWRTNSGSKACLARGPISFADSVQDND